MKDTSHIKNLLVAYSKIEKTNYKAKVQFYHDQQVQIDQLLTIEKFEIDVDYSFALFELGKYHKCLEVLETLIEQVILENIFILNGEDVFHSLLFKKSACHYNLDEPNKSSHVLQELIKMDSSNAIYKTFLRRCLRNEFNLEYRWMGGLVVGLFLFAAMIISVELLVIRPFYLESAFAVEISRNLVFAIAILVLAAREFFFHRSFTNKLTSLKS